MDAETICRIAHDLCGETFAGVFPFNHLPIPIHDKDLLFIANTHECNLLGEHWFSIFISRDGIGEYFDSFGRYPDETISTYMNTHCKSWTFNGRQLQSFVSYFCGHYCIFYCVYRCRDFNMNVITSWFTNDTGLNDHLVHKFVCSSIMK